MQSISRIALRSPNGRISVVIGLDAAGRVTYSVAFDRRPLIAPSSLGLRLPMGREVSSGLRLIRVTRHRADRTYTLLTGKTGMARDHYHQLRLDLEQADITVERRRLQLTFRAYDDGVAFRYRLPALHRREVIRLEDELTRFEFPHDLGCWALNLRTFDTSHEGEFSFMPASMIGETDLLDTPLVCQAGHATFAIAEADLKDYAGLYLRQLGKSATGVQTRLSPRHDEPSVAVRLPPGTDLLSPWRVVMIADRPGDLIHSTLITSLNPPSRIARTDWIRPGKYVWDWWSGRVLCGTEPAEMATGTIRKLIDFAAGTGLQYMMIDAGWYVSGQDGEGGRDADVTRSIAQIDLPELVAYAQQRAIGLIVWVHWKALDARMDEALALYQRLGLKGIKVDFMDRNDQEMVAFYHRLLAKAAQHELLVDLHGSYPPTGLARTWPNLLTQEGVLGAEYNKWSARVTATHNVTIPFTRMLLGPMDYTPGGFLNVRPGEFTARSTLPLVQTTRAHGLAMYVVYESALVSLADSPASYRDQAGMDFLAAVPTTWDATRAIAGAIGQYIVIARRNGLDWYIGAMTNEVERVVHVPLDFLREGGYTARIYADGDSPATLAITQKAVRRHDVIELRLAPSGGAAIHLRPL